MKVGISAKLLLGTGIMTASVLLFAGSAGAVDAPRSQGPCGDTPVVGGLLGGSGACQVVDPVLEVLDPVVAPVTQAAAPVTAPVEGLVARTGLPVRSAGPAAGQAAAAPTPAVAMAAVEPVAGPFVPADFVRAAAPQVGAFNFAGAGLYDYSSLLGGAAKFGELQYGDLFNGYAPEFGILGAEESPSARDVAAAGRAQALETDGSDRIALPILLATLMLSAVTAGLIRSCGYSAPKIRTRRTDQVG